MFICGIFGFWEYIIVAAVLIAFIFPAILRKIRGRTDMTEKLDQLERLERMFRDGSISEREYKRQKRKVMKK